MSTLTIVFRLVNNSSTLPLILAGGVYSLISRIRVFCQGSLVEDCSHYARVHHLITELLSPSNWRVNAAVESNLKQFNPASAKDPTNVEVIDPGEYATVLFTPSALGIINCGKLWPVEMAPLRIEITFAAPADAVISNANMYPRNSASSVDYVTKQFASPMLTGHSRQRLDELIQKLACEWPKFKHSGPEHFHASPYYASKLKQCPDLHGAGAFEAWSATFELH